MAAATQPLDSNYSDSESWQTLVADQRYRLFAAGNRRAAIAESLPQHSLEANQKEIARGPRGFDARFGLMHDATKRLVLVTEVSRVPTGLARNSACLDATAEGHQWRWEASHSLQPISELKSYIDEHSGCNVFFLTRSKHPAGTPGQGTRERLVDSAVRIGRSLGLDTKNLEALRVAGIVHELGKISPPSANGEKCYFTADDERDGGETCRVAECGNAATTRLLADAYCTQHFISTCYERLDGCADRLSRRPATEEESEKLWAFLRGCIEQAQVLTRDPFHQESLERARLLDIQHTASELSRHMRRSARLVEAIPVRLLCETPGRPWQESLSTKLISQHGAMIECEHMVRPEDWLFVERVDTGSRTRARMAWRGSAAAGHFAVALEFMDAENFWELRWDGRSSRPPGKKARGASA